MQSKFNFFPAVSVLVALFLCPPTAVYAAGKRSPKTNKEAGFTSKIETAIGYDDNVYLTPTDAYVDYTPTIPVTIVPQLQSGYFSNIDVRAAYESALSIRMNGLISYRFKGKYYLASEDENADEYDNRFRAGLRFRASPSQSIKKDYIYIGAFYGQHKELYIDRDDGSAQTSGGQNIADRYRYDNYGATASYSKKSGVINLGLDAKFEHRDYEDPPLTTIAKTYDYDSYSAGASIRFPLAKIIKLKLKYRYSDKDYDVKNSRNLQGDLLSSLPTRHYTYNSLGATLRTRFSKQFIMYLDYAHKTRTDEYVGYDNYTRNIYVLRLVAKPIKALRLKLNTSYWQRDYDKAFAFDNPSQARKEYDGYKAELNIEYKLNKIWSIFAGDEYELQNTTDKRYEYDRNQVFSGVRFRY